MSLQPGAVTTPNGAAEEGSSSPALAPAAAEPGSVVGTAGLDGGGCPPVPAPPPSSPKQPKSVVGYPFPLSTLESALAIPPLENQVGAHVMHFVVHRDGPATEVLAELLGVPQELAARLIWFGAVYFCPVPPLPPSSPPASSQPQKQSKKQQQKGKGGGAAGALGGETSPKTEAEVEAERMVAVRQAALARWGRHSKHQTPRRLADPAALLSEGGYLRAHCHPKRFPVAHGLSRPADWAPRLLAVRADHVVVNKPAGLQVPPTVDNIQESLLACVEKALSLPPNSLAPAHRLDAGTEGVVVLARGAAFASYFRGLMAAKEQHGVRKRYRCLVPLTPPWRTTATTALTALTATTTAATTAILEGGGGAPASSAQPSCPHKKQPPSPQQQSPATRLPHPQRHPHPQPHPHPHSHADVGGPPLGRLAHWVLEDQRQTGEAAHTVVVGEDTPGAARCELRVEQVERVRLGPRAEAMWEVGEALEVEITLITGRTHQVRVQMAALGLPLLGDRLYGALVAEGRLIRTQPQEEQQQQQDSEEGQQELEQGRAQQQQQQQQPHQQAGARGRKRHSGGDDVGDGNNGGGGGDGGGDGAAEGAASEAGEPARQPPQQAQQQQQAMRGVALDWCLPALQQPLAPLALQAHSLEVLEDGPMGQAPAVFCAGEPWWR